MSLSPKQMVVPRSNSVLRRVSNNRRNARIQLRYELLEPRHLLANDIDLVGVQASAAYEQPISTESPKGYTPTNTPTNTPITWFEHFDSVSRVSLESLATVDRPLPNDAAGPQELAVGEWIVQLTETAIEDVVRIQDAEMLLRSHDASLDLKVISGLGRDGLLLVRGQGTTRADIEASLASNENVARFSLNQLIRGQDIAPNDTDFTTGRMTSLELIGLPSAWEETIGDLNTVVGVLDTGLDLDHRDIYLNVWFNQGEIPSRFYGNDGNLLLHDIDDDGLITFYDLNHATRSSTAPFELTVAGFENGLNAEFVEDLDLNGNGYIDALDILASPLWADGRDTDGNSEVDDFFGVNLRDGVRNNPNDGQGHGTHVAGTIGAIGGNGIGVTGINWQTSLMPLRILDNSNQGDTGAAIRAINYAKSMRERYRINDDGRVVAGANVRVLNNSWGQPGGEEAALETVITESGEAGILFVAAAGNGNFLGQGVNNDRTPFYPASYNSPNLIAVAASTLDDRLASFSNFGMTSVDIAAPGVGIRSTEANGDFGTRNGTSMATPHVSGTAALIWSALPFATVDEVKEAIEKSAEQTIPLVGLVATGGVVNTAVALQANSFAPVARLISKQDIREAGRNSTEFTVEFSHPTGVNTQSLGDGNFLVSRQWGSEIDAPAKLKDFRLVDDVRTIEATYIVDAVPFTNIDLEDGLPVDINWKPLDFGEYKISSVAGSVQSISGRPILAQELGSFHVRIEDVSIIYVESRDDNPGTNTLRDAIIQANAASPQQRTIILDDEVYRLSIEPVVDPNSSFPTPTIFIGALASLSDAKWSGEGTGDLDVTGNIIIIGDRNDQTIIDAQGVDRAFKVHPEARLELHRVTIRGGQSPQGQSGGGVLSQGFLKVSQSTIRDNVVPTGRTEFDEIISEQTGEPPIRLGGGGITAWAGSLRVDNSWIDKNHSDIGAGIFLIGDTDAIVERSTISNNFGGGIETLSTRSVIISNSTFSANSEGTGTLAANFQGAIRPVAPPPPIKTRTQDGRFLVFGGVLRSNVPEDTNGLSDVYLFDSLFNAFELISVSSDGVLANGPSDPSNVALISNDGRFVVFESQASNLVADDTNLSQDIFIRDRVDNVTFRIHLNDPSLVAAADIVLLSISDDASRIVFSSRARSIAGGPGDGQPNLYVHDVKSDETIKITEADNPFFRIDGAAISGDGNFIAFGSTGRNIVTNDFNNAGDIFVYNVSQGFTERVSVTSSGLESNGLSFNPSLSRDGGLVYFNSDATNLDPSNPVLGTKEFVHDRVLRETFLRSAPADAASIFADQVTIFDDQVNDQPIVTGRVTLSNTLLSARSANPLGDSVTRLNVIGPERFGVHLVSPLVALGSEPPVHELLADNPAIDAGTGRFGTDQRGRGRIGFADVGATEAVSGSFVASLFVDLNGNQRRDLREPGLDSVVVLVRDQSGRLVRQSTTSLDDRTTEIDEHGQFQFLNLESGVYQFVFDIPESFQISQSPFAEIRRSAELVSTSRDSELVAFSSSATNLVIGDRNSKQDVFVLERSSNAVQRVTRGLMGQEPDGDSRQPSMSADGRYVVYTSNATNLAVSDDEGFDDVFIFDRQNAVTTRMSVAFRDLINRNDVGGNGDSHSPRVSPDGSKVVFVSSASNLVPDDSNENVEDVFVYDVLRDNISRVSGSIIGAEFESRKSFEPVISIGGNSIALTSKERFVFNGDIDINPDEVPLDSDVLFFRASPFGIIDPISIAFTASTPNGGGSANGTSHSPAMDDQGRFLAFVSDASNLVGGDDNGVSDIFVRSTGPNAPLFRLMPDQLLGVEADGPSHSPSVSGDGRFIVFVSSATNWVNDQNNQHESVYIFSGVDGRIKRVSETISGVSPNGDSRFPVFSPDGQFITFTTDANNLFTASTPPGGGTVTVPNPFIEPSATVEIRSGQQIVGRSFGLAPKSGKIAGRIFLDEFIANRQFDPGEMVLSGQELFLDLNLDGRADANEPRTRSDNEGNYEFNVVPTLREVVVIVSPQVGFEQVAPENGTLLGFSVFLPAGGIVNGLDVGFRSVASTGQSSDSTIRGRVMIDSNRNGIIDDDDAPAANRVVYMDAGTLGVRDFNDPQAVTNADGIFEFTGLPATITPLRVLLDETLEQTSPVGSSFELEKFPLQDIEKREGNPQAVVTGLFNDDTFPDAAVLLAETNTLSIRLNDGRGGFLPQKLDVNLSDLVARRVGAQQRFLQPTSIVTGDFDGIAGLDVAITGNFSRNVLVLRNFDVERFDPEQDEFGFSDEQLVEAGNEPLDIVAGHFSGDAATDLVVLNKGDSTVRILTNNGSLLFTAGPAINTGGVNAASLVAADFTRDGKLDLAVTHSVTSLTNATTGRVTVLVGDGNGGLVLSPDAYTVQAGAVDSAVGDFNGDDHPDLAVVNLLSNSISILLNQSNGKLRVQSTTLGTTQGAVDIAVADIDGDGDDDILATKLQRREIAIFRNIGVDEATGNVRFEPQEAIGVGEFSFAERSPFALANLDQDTSGPNGTGTIDIVAVPQNTDTLFVLKNTLVQGSRRATVSGARTDIASGVDFLIRPAILLPSFTFESLPQPIIEDAPEQTVVIQNITKGRRTGPALQFSVVSSNPALIASATVTLIEGTDRATLRYTPLKDANGTTVLTVRAIDAGADATFDNADDGVFERSFTVTVLAVDDPDPLIKLSSGNEVVDMRGTPTSFLANISVIDIRGMGNNSLVLDAAKIRSVTPNQTLRVIANGGDRISFGDGWMFAGVETVDGQLQRTFQNDGAIVRVVGPLDWTNPNIAGDVNGSGDVTAGDALDIIFSLGQPQLFDSQGRLVDATTVAPASFRFYDPNEDGMSTAADALFVINILFLQSLGGSGEGEANVGQSALLERRVFGAEKAGDVSANVDSRLLTSVKGGRQMRSAAQPDVDAKLLSVSLVEDTQSEQEEGVGTGALDATIASVWDWLE